MAVLNGLPERFNSLISALDALGNEDEAFSLDFVKSRLLQEEQRIEMRTRASSTKSETSALFSTRGKKQARIPQLRKIAEKQDIRLSLLGEVSDLLQTSWRKRNKKRTPKDTAFIAEKQENC